MSFRGTQIDPLRSHSVPQLFSPQFSPVFWVETTCLVLVPGSGGRGVEEREEGTGAGAVPSLHVGSAVR
jgi:hypothetical protein